MPRTVGDATLPAAPPVAVVDVGTPFEPAVGAAPEGKTALFAGGGTAAADGGAADVGTADDGIPEEGIPEEAGAETAAGQACGCSGRGY